VQRAALILLFACAPAWGFDANGVALGATQAVVQAFDMRVDLNVWRGDFDTEIYRFR
jgi:hypothetical protein